MVYSVRVTATRRSIFMYPEDQDHSYDHLSKESWELLKKIYEQHSTSGVLPLNQDLTNNINIALKAIENSKQEISLRLELITKTINAGYYDIFFTDADQLNPNNPMESVHLRRMLGFDTETDFPNVLGSWSSRVHSEDRWRVYQLLTAHLNDHSGHTPVDVKYRFRIKTGEYRWFRGTGTATRDETGKPLRFIGIMYDIQENQAKEQELQSLLMRLELINSAMLEGGFAFSALDFDPLNDRTYQTEMWFSPQFRKLIGFNDETDFPNVAVNWIDRLHPDDKEYVLKAYAAHRNDHSGKTSHSVDYRFRLRNGDYSWFQTTAITVRDDKGTPLYTAGTIRNIDHEKRKEEYEKRIITINNQLTSTLESISEGVIAINPDGFITQINSQAVEMIEAKNKQVIGKDISIILNCGDYFRQIMSSGKKIDDMEMTFNTSSGPLNFIISVTPFKSDEDTADGLVITLKEKKLVQKLVNRMTGSKARFTFESIIGKSEKIMEAIKIARVAANSSSHALLLGESGTGKEMFAQAIHNHSDRCEGPFIAINCGALPRGLIESELFGYEGGSFTGARREGHPGKFELADGGTIFLDEIGDMPMESQANLLRVLQNKEILRIGGKKTKQIDVRIIAATNKDLETGIRNQTFRDDLYYRLNVLSVPIPPLRERVEDIELLTEYFINKYNAFLKKKIEGVSPEAYQALFRYTWPGNIRELENIVERAVNITLQNYILLSDLPSHIVTYCGESPNIISNFPDNIGIRKFAYDLMINYMKANEGNIRKTATQMGLSRTTLYRKLKANGFNSVTFRDHCRLHNNSTRE